MIRRLRSIHILAILALAACNTSGGTAPGIPGGSSAAMPASAGTRTALSDDWITMGHDYMRTGMQPQPIDLSRRNVKGLTLRWKRFIGSSACTIPGAPQCLYSGVLAYGGNVLIVSFYGVYGKWNNPSVYDYSAKTGKLLWKYLIDAQVRAQPSIDPGQNLVIVSTHPVNYTTRQAEPGELYAIDLTTGRLRWKASTAGDSHGAVVVAGGKIYIGNGGGDPPGCLNGGVQAFDETTGKRLWTWLVNPAMNPGGGGSSWGSMGYDGVHLLVPTGNTCSTPVTTADGMVALDPANGKVAWSFVAQQNSYDDDDTGGGIMYSKGQAVFINKNGSVYSLVAATGQETWGTQLNPRDGLGGFSTPSSDGSTIIVGAGAFFSKTGTARAVGAGPVCRVKYMPRGIIAGVFSYIVGLDTAGSVLWKREVPQEMIGQVAIVNGLAFTGVGTNFAALDIRTGKTLWRYQGTSLFDPAPAVVPSGIYTADDTGHVYAFNLPK